MPSNWFFDYDKIVRFSRARSTDMNEIFASIMDGFAKTNDYMVVTGNLAMTATDQRRLLIVPSGAITITLPSAGTLTAATERDIELLFGGLPTNNVILPASPAASINFNSVTVEGKTVATGQIKLASAGAYLRLRYSPSAGTYLIVDQGTAPRVFGTPSSGTNIAPWAWYGDHVVIDSVTDAAITAIAMPTSKLLGRSFFVTVAAAMLSGVAVGGGSDTINGEAGPLTVAPGQTVEFLRTDADWQTKLIGGTQQRIVLRNPSVELVTDDLQADVSWSSVVVDSSGSISVPDDDPVVPWDVDGTPGGRYMKLAVGGKYPNNMSGNFDLCTIAISKLAAGLAEIANFKVDCTRPEAYEETNFRFETIVLAWSSADKIYTRISINSATDGTVFEDVYLELELIE